MDRDHSAPNLCGECSSRHDDNSASMIDNMFNVNPQQEMQSMPQQQQPHQLSPSRVPTPSFDKMSFVDVMHFTDFIPKLSLSQAMNQDHQETGIDPIYFLKFPVLNEKIEDHNQTQHLMYSHKTPQEGGDCVGNIGNACIGGGEKEEDRENNNVKTKEVRRKRKRARTGKTVEEMESQRMAHVTVERNRRKQMNEHLRVLRSLMPGSYVKKGDQASIIGGVIKFVRELEQLLECLELQKRRRILGETDHRQVGDMTMPTDSSSSPTHVVANQTQPLITTQNVTEQEGGRTGGGHLEEMAEKRSCLADVEVKLLGFDAMIKILSRRRPGQLIMTMAALEDLHLSILHTNITTMEQTVMYSFNVKVTGEMRFTAEEIASYIQQIFSFIHENATM